MKTIYRISKQLLVTLLLSLIILPAAGQTPSTEYFMESSYQRLSFNPALRPRQGYINIPGLGATSADAQTNTLNLDHLAFKKDGKTVLFTSSLVSADEFLSDMSKNNYLGAGVNESFLGAGWFINQKGFLFVDISVRIDAEANIPYSFFEFAKKGIADNVASQYNFKNFEIDARSYIDIGAGYSHSLLDNDLVVGGKFKVLLGLAYVNGKINEMNINAGIDEWIVNSDISIQGALMGSQITPEYKVKNGVERFDDINTDFKFGIPGFGLGLDLGASFNLGGLTHFFPDIDNVNLLKRFNFSLAFTNIGFISWSKSKTTHLASKMEDTVITGSYQIDLDNSNSLGDQVDELTERLKDIVDLKEQDAKGRTTSLSTNMNIGLEYEAIPEKLSVGILSATRFNPVKTTSELTLGGSYRPCNWFEAGLSYSCIFNQFNTFGLALHIAPKKGVNFFLSSDYLVPSVNKEFIPVKAKGMNFLVGVSIPIGARR